MKELILDYSKWRCGGDEKNRLGEGGTYLLNEQGYMCCLGQFCKQINSDITDYDIENKLTPEMVGKNCEDLAERSENVLGRRNTKLSREAIHINDDTQSTPGEKIELLERLFQENGYTIKVINEPERAVPAES